MVIIQLTMVITQLTMVITQLTMIITQLTMIITQLTMIITQTYNVPSGTYASNPRNSQAVIAFEAEAQYFSSADLAQFFQVVGLPPQVPFVHGHNNESVTGGESTLDVSGSAACLTCDVA